MQIVSDTASTFAQLKPGDAFYWGGTLYMRVDTATTIGSMRAWLAPPQEGVAVRLKDGILSLFINDAEVTPVVCTVRVSRPNQG